MKKRKIFSIIVLIAIIALFCSGCAKLPVPEVKEGRFDFSITYEVDGVENTYSGVYVCKYDGIYVTFIGEGRVWEGTVENLGTDIAIAVKTVGNVVIYIDFGLDPKYFMSDPEHQGEEPAPIIYGQATDEETGEENFFGDEEIYENYGVRIISYEYAEPIENSYNEKWSIGVFIPEIN